MVLSLRVMDSAWYVTNMRLTGPIAGSRQLVAVITYLSQVVTKYGPIT